MIRLIVVLVLVVLVCSVVAADTCVWVPNCDSNGICSYDQVCSPEYSAWQYAEPDWCLYSTNDKVAVQFANGQMSAWYVVRAGNSCPSCEYVVYKDATSCDIYLFDN